MQSEYQIILTTCPDQSYAEDLARQLIQAELAACVNIVPGLTSIYKWDGEIKTGTEVQLIIKTRSTNYPQIEQYITSLHPYELPEIISVPITNALPDYLQWIDFATGKS